MHHQFILMLHTMYHLYNSSRLLETCICFKLKFYFLKKLFVVFKIKILQLAIYYLLMELLSLQKLNYKTKLELPFRLCNRIGYQLVSLEGILL